MRTRKNKKEFSSHKKIAKELEVLAYFAKPYRF
jgi:IS30 family transposase